MQQAARKWSPLSILIGTLILSALPLLAVEIFPGQLKFVMAPSAYMVFHNIVEFFSIMVSLSMFGMCWYTYEQSKNRHTLFLGAAFLAIGLMDFMHTLSMPAMPDFITPNGPQKSVQFWMPVRVFQAVAFLASAYVYPDSPGRWLTKRILIASSLLASLLVFIGIIFFQPYMPTLFVPGVGLTPLKKFCEYAVIFLLGAATVAYWRRTDKTGDRLLLYYLAAFVVSIFSELPLAFYARAFDTYNVLGHINKVIAFFLIYYGVYRTSVKAPYLRLTEVGEKLKEENAERRRTEEALREARDSLELRVEERTAELVQINARLQTEVEDRRKAQEALRKARDRALWLARFPDENPNPVMRVAENGTVLYCNPASMKAPGCKCRIGEPLQGELIPLFRRAMAEGREIQADKEMGGRTYFIWIAPFPEERYANIYGRDITDRRQAEEKIRRQNALQQGINRIFREAIASDTEEGLGKVCLSVIEDVTGSKFSFIGEFGPDGLLHDIAISDPGWELCSMDDKTGHRRSPGNFKIHGLYGRVLEDGKPFYTNDPISHPASIGTPEGHPPLKAFLGVPLNREGRTSGMIAVGNREGGYGREELEALEALAPAILECFGRIRAETGLKQRTLELQQLNQTLEFRVRERTEELAKSQERLRHLASQLLLAQEKERKRVAFELHDGLLSELAAMKMLFETKMKLLEQGNLAELGEFKKISDILARVMKEARGIMNNLHPSILDELGLIAAINWLSGEYQKAYPAIKVQKRIEVSERDIPESIRVVIYRVLQEALNNFAKYGKGDRVDLSLAKSDHSFALVIQDNGQGFDVETAKKGLGLESMRERVEVSGGEFRIESAAGRGTTIRAVWSNS